MLTYEKGTQLDSSSPWHWAASSPLQSTRREDIVRNEFKRVVRLDNRARCGGGRMYSHLHGSGTTNVCLTSVMIVKDLVDEREDMHLLLKLKERQEG